MCHSGQSCQSDEATSLAAKRHEKVSNNFNLLFLDLTCRNYKTYAQYSLPLERCAKFRLVTMPVL